MKRCDPPEPAGLYGPDERGIFGRRGVALDLRKMLPEQSIARTNATSTG
jgi:hypothetical protein